MPSPSLALLEAQVLWASRMPICYSLITQCRWYCGRLTNHGCVQECTFRPALISEQLVDHGKALLQATNSSHFELPYDYPESPETRKYNVSGPLSTASVHHTLDMMAGDVCCCHLVVHQTLRCKADSACCVSRSTVQLSVCSWWRILG